MSSILTGSTIRTPVPGLFCGERVPSPHLSESERIAKPRDESGENPGSVISVRSRDRPPKSENPAQGGLGGASEKAQQGSWQFGQYSERRLPSTTVDLFTRDRREWLERLQCDPSVTHLACRVGAVIATHLNRRTGDCWPAQETIAKQVKANVRSIRRSVRQLEALGYLVVTPGRGRSRVTVYRLGNPAEKEDQNRTAESAFVIVKEDQNRTAESAFLHQKGDKSGPSGPTNPLIIDREKESPSIPQKRKRSPAKPAIKVDPGDFDRWYAAYPLHKGRLAAERAYARVIASRKATAPELLAGAARYAASRAGQPPRWTKHPATWLNGGCWLDEPDAAPSPTTFAVTPDLQDRIEKYALEEGYLS